MNYNHSATTDIGKLSMFSLYESSSATGGWKEFNCGGKFKPKFLSLERGLQMNANFVGRITLFH